MKKLMLAYLFISVIYNTIDAQNLDIIGTAKVSSLAGTGNRVLLSDQNGFLQNAGSGLNGQVLTTNGNSVIWSNPSSAGWGLNGNSVTNSSNNFIGTTDAVDLSFRTNNLKRMGITSAGNVFIGTFSFASQSHLQVVTENNFQTGLSVFMRSSPLNLKFGISSSMETDSGQSGSLFGINNTIGGKGDHVAVGISNNITLTGTGLKYGITTAVVDSPGTKMGIRNTVGALNNGTGISSGQITAIFNSINNSNNDTKYGLRNSIVNSNGLTYGIYNIITGGSSNTLPIYGTYNNVTTQASSGSVAGYFRATGVGATAAIFDSGTVIINESGTNYDTRMESENNEYAFWLDANEDLVNFGSAFGSAYLNGSDVGGTTIDYVADFDNGAASGTTIGIGSIEYLLDGVAETIINNDFTPSIHMAYDLGFSTTSRAWDDVFADNFVNVSDRREKSNINHLSYGLDEILAMRPVSYTLNNDLNQEIKIGLIAQEVLSLIPEAVKTHDYKIADESNMERQRVPLDRMGMTYHSLIPVLINATQEQQKIIDKQQIQIQSQQKQIELLVNQFDILKSELKE